MSARKLILLGDSSAVGMSYPILRPDTVFNNMPITSRGETTDGILTPDIMEEIPKYRADPLIKSKVTESKVASMSLEFTDVCVSRNSSNPTGCSNTPIVESRKHSVYSREYSLDNVVIHWPVFFGDYKDSNIAEECIKEMEINSKRIANECTLTQDEWAFLQDPYGVLFDRKLSKLYILIESGVKRILLEHGIKIKQDEKTED